MKKLYRIVLPIVSSTAYQLKELITKGDNNTHIFDVHLMNENEAFNLDEVTNIKVNVLKADNTVTMSTFNSGVEIIDRANGNIQITLKSNMLNILGTTKMSIELYKGEDRLTSSIVLYRVIGSLADNDTSVEENDNAYSALQELIRTESGTITIGNVTSGSTPSVTNVGTNTAAILDFVLVPGATGATGAQGPQGVKGATGAQGATGAAGKDGISPSITVNTNTSTTYTLNITDASGTFTTPNLKGAAGTNGTNGTDGTVGAGNAAEVSFTPPTDMTSTNVQSAIEEVFQSLDNMQVAYETSIIGKGGTVSKAGEVATKTEIVAGIESISGGTSGQSVFTETDINSIEEVIKQKSGTVEKASTVATVTEIQAGIESIPGKNEMMISDTKIALYVDELEDLSPSQLSIVNAGATLTSGLFNKQALHFDGSTYMTVNAPNDIFSGDTTIEFFVKLPTTTQVTYASFIAKQSSTANNIWSLRSNLGSATPTACFVYYNDGWKQTAGTIPLNDNTWHHIAYVKSGLTVTVFVDGVIDYTVTLVSGATLSNSHELTIGRITHEDCRLNGDMQEVTISKYAKYTAPFTVPTEPLAKVMSYDAFYADDISTLETTVINQGGTVTKASTVATADEIKAGINSIEHYISTLPSGIVKPLTSDSLDGYKVTYSGQYLSEGPMYAYNAFNYDTALTSITSCWSASGTANWIQIELPQAAIVNKTLLLARPWSSTTTSVFQSPKTFQILGSNDGTYFTTLLSVTDAPEWYYQDKGKEYTISNTTAYKYYRLNVSGVYSGGYTSLGRWYLYDGTENVVYEPLYASNIQALETTITDLGGTVTKASSIATADELIAGIISIVTNHQ